MRATGVMNAILGSYEMRSFKHWRDEDVAYRDQEMQWRSDKILRQIEWRRADIERVLRREKAEHEYRICEARVEQLHAASEQCALLGGFAVIAMSNLDIPDGTNRVLFFVYGVSAALVAVLLLLATAVCTLLMVAVTRYAAQSLEDNIKELDVAKIEIMSPFSSWWLQKCEREQMMAYKLMCSGIVVFFVYLPALSWIQFHKSSWAYGSITGMCFVAVVVWQIRIASRWKYLLQPPIDPVFRPSCAYPESMVDTTPYSLRQTAVANYQVCPSPVSVTISSAYA